MKHSRFIIVVSLITLTFALPAYAYLDPGSGSIILQGILAALAGIIATIKLYWRKLKNFCCRCIGKKPKEKLPSKEDDDHSTS